MNKFKQWVFRKFYEDDVDQLMAIHLLKSYEFQEMFDDLELATDELVDTLITRETLADFA